MVGLTPAALLRIVLPLAVWIPSRRAVPVQLKREEYGVRDVALKVCRQATTAPNSEPTQAEGK